MIFSKKRHLVKIRKTKYKWYCQTAILQFHLARLRQKLASRAFCRHCSIAFYSRPRHVHGLCSGFGVFHSPWKFIIESFFSTGWWCFLESSITFLHLSINFAIFKVASLNQQSFHQRRAPPYDVRKDESRPWTSIHGTSPVATSDDILPFFGCLKQRGGNIYVYTTYKNTTYKKVGQSASNII